MRYYLIAGEASGDLHGSNLIKALYEQDPKAEIRCWGGDLMEAAGGDLAKHYRDLAFMGFVEVLRHLPEILKNLKSCKQDIMAFKPDVVVLIDYPGFNLRIASWASENGFKTCYYISPQLWAWKENRIKQIKQSVDKMLVILPFEEAFYQRHGYKAIFVGHPLTEIIEKELQQPAIPLDEKPVIALLPGSRKQEIRTKLPVMLQMPEYFPSYQFIVARAPGQVECLYQNIIGDRPVRILNNQTYNLLKQASAALVTSGTATLETALFGVPQVVCYKGNRFSYWLAKLLVKIKYISLVNLILDKPAVKELIQDDFTAEQLRKELNNILQDKERQDELQSDYTRLWELLGPLKSAQLAAREITELARM
jgi:lipid-A-disaccharide synthase